MELGCLSNEGQHQTGISSDLNKLLGSSPMSLLRNGNMSKQTKMNSVSCCARWGKCSPRDIRVMIIFWNLSLLLRFSNQLTSSVTAALIPAAELVLSLASSNNSKAAVYALMSRMIASMLYPSNSSVMSTKNGFCGCANFKNQNQWSRWRIHLRLSGSTCPRGAAMKT